MDNIRFPTQIGEMERRFGCVPCVMLKKVKCLGLLDILGPDVKAARSLPRGLTLFPGDLVILPVRSELLTTGWARKAVPRTASDDFRVETQAERYFWPFDRPEHCPWPERPVRRKHLYEAVRPGQILEQF